MNYHFFELYSIKMSFNLLSVHKRFKINNDTLFHYWKIIKYALVKYSLKIDLNFL